MKLYIKNMVCPRCISAVEKTFEDIKIKPVQVQLGEVTLSKELNGKQALLIKEKRQSSVNTASR